MSHGRANHKFSNNICVLIWAYWWCGWILYFFLLLVYYKKKRVLFPCMNVCSIVCKLWGSKSFSVFGISFVWWKYGILVVGNYVGKLLAIWICFCCGCVCTEKWSNLEFLLMFMHGWIDTRENGMFKRVV